MVGRHQVAESASRGSEWVGTIFASRCIFASDLYWFSSKEVFIKSLNGVGKEKKLYAKKWYKKELV
jgi:hypothetical protein